MWAYGRKCALGGSCGGVNFALNNTKCKSFALASTPSQPICNPRILLCLQDRHPAALDRSTGLRHTQPGVRALTAPQQRRPIARISADWNGLQHIGLENSSATAAMGRRRIMNRPTALGLLGASRNNINGSSFLVWAVLLSGTGLATSSRHRGHFMDRPARGPQGSPRGGRVQSLTAPASKAALIAPRNRALKDGSYDGQGVRDCTHHWPIQASLCGPIPFNAATRPDSRS
ncbi:hypothetical protein SSKA14_1465 [Stenotrophomonas sp. SKA14]|nr:hypothetical protein SSKA14_1465 [Stenotrophomonas sp. SKA14]